MTQNEAVGEVIVSAGDEINDPPRSFVKRPERNGSIVEVFEDGRYWIRFFRRGRPCIVERPSGKRWYEEDEAPITEPCGPQDRPCPKCGLPPTAEGYDACLGWIPGATSACCGHGVEMPGVAFRGDAVSWVIDAVRAWEIHHPLWDRVAHSEGG